MLQIRRFCLVLFSGALLWGPQPALATEGFSVTLNGEQEVPPVATAAFAGSHLSLDGTTLSFRIVSSGIDLDGNQTPGVPGDDLNGIHIHEAVAGTNGGIVHDLGAATRDAPNGTVTGSVVLTAGQITSIRNEGLYINLHTMANGGGEIRGQILPLVAAFDATLDGSQEVPSPVTTTANGTGVLLLTRARDRLAVQLNLNGLDLDGAQTGTTADDVTGGHIHRAPAGVNGPVVFGFITPNNDTNGNLNIDAAAGTIFSIWDAAEGNGTTLADELDELRSDGLYFNFHTVANSGGEIRGQIAISSLLDDLDLDGIPDFEDLTDATPDNPCQVYGDDVVLIDPLVVNGGTTVQCAAAETISVSDQVSIAVTGELHLLAPVVSFGNDFAVPQGAILRVDGI